MHAVICCDAGTVHYCSIVAHWPLLMRLCSCFVASRAFNYMKVGLFAPPLLLLVRAHLSGVRFKIGLSAVCYDNL